MSDNLLESSHRDDSNKLSNIGFEEDNRHYRNKNVHPIWSHENIRREIA